MSLVDVEAGDPPVRTRRRMLVVLALVLDARQFPGAAVLTPSLCGAVLVEDERGVSAICPNPVLLGRTVTDPPLAGLRVVTDTPAPTKDPVVALNKLGEKCPRRGIQGSDRVRHSSSPSRTVISPAPGGRHVRPRRPLQQGGERVRSAC